MSGVLYNARNFARKYDDIVWHGKLTVIVPAEILL